MIKITTATKKSVHAFNDKAWHDVDIEHYGKVVDWKEYSFKFKATENDTIVGTIAGKCYPGVVYVDALIVDEKQRGKGIGKLLLQKAEKFGIKHAAHKITLETGADWKARDFYESQGYKVTAELPNHYFNHDFVVYTKLLI